MKKVTSLLLILAFCIGMCACNKTNTIPATEISTEAPQHVELGIDYLYGTWQAFGVIINGVSLSLDELEKLGQETNLENFYLIIENGGTYYLSADNSFYNWSFTSDSLTLGGVECSYVDGIIGIPAKDFTLSLHKISDIQDISGIPDYDNTIIEEPASIDSNSEVASNSGLRPEFKEAMDAYEAFYDEYCDFMLEYKENPTDMNLLFKYTEMLTKLTEMDAAFNSWDQAEMTNEELKYYLDVNNRVMQKLLDVTN